MKLLVGAPRGFCAGVEMAIAALERALGLFGAPVYCYHQIVHNAFVVSSFRGRGVIFVNELAQVPRGSTVVFSAHGVAPAVREEARARQLRVVDATCPLVTKVHSEARHFDQRAYTLLLIAHQGHDETRGVMGEAAGVRLLESVADAERVEVPDPARVAYLTQTTLSVDDAARIIAVLRRRFPEIQGPPQDDICYATQNRQEAVRALAQEADLILVLGSANSSNSMRLVEVAESQGVPGYLVDGPSNVEAGWLRGAETVGLMAGASAPESLVRQMVGWFVDRFGAAVEERVYGRESLRFQLPVELRRAGAPAGVTWLQPSAAPARAPEKG